MSNSEMYAIFSNDKCLGYVEFKSADESMGVYFGLFNPEQSYFDVQHIFQLYTEALNLEDRDRDSGQTLLNDFYHARDNLNLSLRWLNGEAIASHFIVILDYTNVDGDQDLRVEVQISDPEFHNQWSKNSKK